MQRTKGSEFLRSNVLGLVAIFIAATGTAVVAEAQEASSAAVSNAKFKKLKQRVGALEATLNTPATGDLLGNYPNLQIAANAVGAGEIASNAVTTLKIADDAVTTAKIPNNAVTSAKIPSDAVTTAKIANDAVTKAKIAAAAVGADELDSINIVTDSQGSIGNGATSGSSGSSCAGSDQIITWGGFWGDLTDPGLRLQSTLFFGSGFTTGSNQSGAAENFTTFAMCLEQ